MVVRKINTFQMISVSSFDKTMHNLFSEKGARKRGCTPKKLKFPEDCCISSMTRYIPAMIKHILVIRGILENKNTILLPYNVVTDGLAD